MCNKKKKKSFSIFLYIFYSMICNLFIYLHMSIVHPVSICTKDISVQFMYSLYCTVFMQYRAHLDVQCSCICTLSRYLYRVQLCLYFSGICALLTQFRQATQQFYNLAQKQHESKHYNRNYRVRPKGSGKEGRSNQLF